MTAHEVLGLPPGPCAKRELKKAYAAALKLHRPDRDSAGFARVREAYEELLNEVDDGPVNHARVALSPVQFTAVFAQLQQRAADEAGNHVAATESSKENSPAESPVENPADIPDEVAPAISGERPVGDNPPTPYASLPPAAPPPRPPDALKALRDLAEQPAHAEADVLANALRQGFAGLIAGSIPASDWDEAVAPFVDLRSQIICETLSDDDLLDEAAHGSGIATATTIEHLFTFAQWERLSTLGQRWAASPPRCSPWLTERIIHKLVVHLAVIDYQLANELVLAAGGARGLHFPDNGSLDRSLMLGSELKNAPAEVRHYVAELLAGGRNPTSRPHLLTAVRKYLAPLPWGSATRQALGARYPKQFRPPAEPVGNATNISLFGFLVSLFGLILSTSFYLLVILIDHGSALSGWAALPIYGGTLWGGIILHRRNKTWWNNTAQPWLTDHLGPFDLRYWLLLLWWMCGPVPWLIDAYDIRQWVWWLGILLAIPVLRLVHHGWKTTATGWRRWLADPHRAGEVAYDLQQRQALETSELLALVPQFLFAALAGTISITTLVQSHHNDVHAVMTIGVLMPLLFFIDAGARCAVAHETGWKATWKQWLPPCFALMVLAAGACGWIWWQRPQT